VARSPWRAGKGDVVREVAQAARKRGIKLAVYLSPADLYQLKTNPTNPAGYYGNGSEKKPSMIPTVPEKFHSEPHVGRPVKNLPKFVYTVDDYNRYFLNQLYELLTEYGEIDEVWFDGANPDPSVRQSYDYLAWYDLIYKLQPNAVIFGKGPDARWVGNEGGYGRETEWSVIPLPVPPDQFTWPDMTDGDLGSREKLKPGSYLWWYPAEVNTPILHGWFWAKGKEVKPASELIDYFYRSVGRNGNMLLNLSPDTRGLIPDDQLQALDAMSETINATFAKDLAEGAKLDTDTAEPDHPAAQALDASLDTWWEAAKGARTATLTLRLPRQTTFDVVSLQEAVDRRGQRIESFEIDHWDGTQWVALDRQTTVGYRRILRIKPVTSDRLRIRITGARLEPTIARLSLYRQAAK
jgi:alpha-L-fucosidase